ncbi:MAG TPA: hypothetical protein VK817_07875 [Trebonia sp.]|jgi:hypothetical protein|nr:hypothetical protein [Trebonia sp.]
MSDIAVPGSGALRAAGTVPAADGAVGGATGTALSLRRALQLGLAGVWLVDALLQYQQFMFTKAFGQMLAEGAPGNPGFLARPITWDATLVEQHAVLLNAIFATVQLLLGLGIAFRPTVRIALGASIAWSLAVWWLGEGLGGVLNGTANPLTGAPGAVIIYALLAVVLWPRSGDSASGDSVAGTFGKTGAAGTRVARALWSVLWLSFAYFALLPANRAPQGTQSAIAANVGGEPAWLAAIERNAASLTAHQGLAISIVFAVAYVVIGVGAWLPRRYRKATLILALVVSAMIWVVGEAFGMILAGGATDANSGPLLALLALAFWPVRSPAGARNSRARDSRARDSRARDSQVRDNDEMTVLEGNDR